MLFFLNIHNLWILIKWKNDKNKKTSELHSRQKGPIASTKVDDSSVKDRAEDKFKELKNKTIKRK